MSRSAVCQGRCLKTLTSCLTTEIDAAAHGYRVPVSDERPCRFVDKNVESFGF